MPTLPWRSFREAEAAREYVVLLSLLQLKHGWRIPGLLRHTVRVMGQLQLTEGLVGYTLFAQPLAKRFWTLSVWKDEAALARFVHAQPHARTMELMTPRLRLTRFVRWRVKGSELPPSWGDALERFQIAADAPR